MIGKDPETIQPGRALVARPVNDAIRAVARARRFRVGSGLAQAELGGIPLVRSTAGVEQPARITGAPTGTAYPFQGIFGTAGGGWADLPPNVSDNSMADPAYEVNARTDVATGTYVLMKRDPSTGEWRFRADSC